MAVLTDQQRKFYETTLSVTKQEISELKDQIEEELAKVKSTGVEGKFDRAAQIFEQMSTQEQFAEFLTLPLYEEI